MLCDNLVCAWGGGGGGGGGGGLRRPNTMTGMGGEKASGESNSEEGGENS